MPSVRQLAKLFKALSERDFQAAEQMAIQIAAVEDKIGHHSAAQLLKGSLRSNGMRGHRPTEPILGTVTKSNLLEGALSTRNSPTRLNDVMLRPSARRAIELLIHETRHRAYLKSRGIRQRCKVLLVGPPGCGKSFTAQAISNELGLPHYVVRFDAVIGAYLGQTAIHLRELFRFAADNPAVLLFDEIDALGKQRGNPLDVGELDRIVIALMQELDLLSTQGLVIATSNLPRNLDRALWRRFDLVLHFPMPTKKELSAYAKMIAKKFNLKAVSPTFKRLATANTYADAERIVEAQARKMALQEINVG